VIQFLKRKKSKEEEKVIDYFGKLKTPLDRQTKIQTRQRGVENKCE
jgi:hypothetical protein